MLSLIKLTSYKKSGSDIKPYLSSKALVIDLNSSKFSSLVSASILFSFSSSSRNPLLLRTSSTSSVSDKCVLASCNSNIKFL